MEKHGCVNVQGQKPDVKDDEELTKWMHNDVESQLSNSGGNTKVITLSKSELVSIVDEIVEVSPQNRSVLSSLEKKKPKMSHC